MPNNETIIWWAVAVIIGWCIWIVFLVIKKLKADALNITGEDVYGWLKR